MMTSTYKITICYDGTEYHGWQRQPRRKTIQGTLESALQNFTEKAVPVIGSGRTDAGVHALGQTAHFKAETALSDEKLLKALNANLPKDIRILALHQVESGFHALKMAKSKVYQYRIFNHTNLSPFLMRYVLHWPGTLDLSLMKEAASLFRREADFTPFSSNRFLFPVRKISRSEIEFQENEIVYTVEANGFLRYMVRTIVGTLMEIGRGRKSPSDIEKIFKEKNRALAGKTAPAKGLCLMKVLY